MTNLPVYLDDACDAIDAALFTGEVFHRNPKALEELEAYIARWHRGIADVKEFHVTIDALEQHAEVTQNA